MKIFGKREPLILLVGDISVLVAALWTSLLLRNLSTPSRELFVSHLGPFAVVFAIFVTNLYIAGLYSKQTSVLRSKLSTSILNTHIASASLSVLFFYLTPFFGITPKIVLFIFIVVSLALILSWRLYGYFFFASRGAENVFVSGSGREAQELLNELRANPVHGFRSVERFEEASLVIADFSDEEVRSAFPDLYKRIFSGQTFLDIRRVYEDIFDRVPLSLLRYDWFLENISAHPRIAYDVLKRIMDVLISLPLILVLLVIYPFVALAIKLEDGGSVLISQERVGKNNKIVKIYKFRSMTGNDQGNYGSQGGTSLRVTRVGAFLRRSRIDEFPQLWSVLRGDQSLIGPRPELPALVDLYDKEIPYYNMRHIIKPGLSGWAQIHQESNHPHHKEAVEETKEKLSYDLYYVKNRSIMLDIKTALRTVKTLLSRVGV